VTTSLLRGDAAADFLRDELPALYAADPGATPFQSPGWCTAWLATAGRAAGVEPIVVAVAGPRPAAIAVQRSTGTEGELVEPLSSPRADYALPVGPGSADPTVLRALVDGVARCGERVLLHEVPDSPLASVLDQAPGFVRGAASATASLTLPGRWAEPLPTGEHARKLRRLARRGHVRCIASNDAATARAALGDLVRLHRAQWAGREDVIAPFDDPVVLATYEAVVTAVGPEEAVVWRLFVGDDVVAAYLCFRRGHVCYAYRPALDVAWFRLSPGHLLLRLMLAQLAAQGVTCFDLMRGEYAYKEAYADSWRCNRTYSSGPATGGGSR
jgi:CelD/BcsL family acetyltransferase involved in cellulose biosynthesis